MFKVMPVHFLKHPSAVIFARGNEATKKPEKGGVYTEQEMAEARAAAYEQGLQAARDQAQHEFAAERAAFDHVRNETFEKLQHQHDSLMGQMTLAIPGLVMEAIHRILGSVDFDAKVITGIVRDLLKEVHPGAGAVEVKLCERDLQIIKGHEGELTHLYPGLRFVSDSHLKTGDCLIHSRYGVVDGRLSAKIENVEALLQ